MEPIFYAAILLFQIIWMGSKNSSPGIADFGKLRKPDIHDHF